MSKRRSAAARNGGYLAGPGGGDDAAGPAEEIPMHRLSIGSRVSGVSSTFTVDTPLMAVASDLDDGGRPVATPMAGVGGRAGAARTEPLNPMDRQPKRRRQRYPANVVSNNKYNAVTFLPLVLFEQFKFFFNLYFLLVALSQLVPQLRIGYLVTYVGPLVFVLLVTMGKELLDDLARRRRDAEANAQRYQRLTPDGPQVVASAKLAVGDLVLIEKNQRVPADMVLLRTTESAGACFVRTDQLD
ncbi:putative aminophospholipid-translocase, partial [Coemansia helicoidea]